MISQIRRLMNPVLMPYKIDSLLFNFLHAIEQIGAGIYLCFFFSPNSPKFSDSFNGSIFSFKISPELTTTISEFGPLFNTYSYEFAMAFFIIKCVCGVCLVLGFLTRPVSVLIIALMVLFLTKMYTVDDFNVACPIIIISVGILSLVIGGGKFSIDFLLTRKSEIV